MGSSHLKARLYTSVAGTKSRTLVRKLYCAFYTTDWSPQQTQTPLTVLKSNTRIMSDHDGEGLWLRAVWCPKQNPNSNAWRVYFDRGTQYGKEPVRWKDIKSVVETQHLKRHDTDSRSREKVRSDDMYRYLDMKSPLSGYRHSPG